MLQEALLYGARRSPPLPRRWRLIGRTMSEALEAFECATGVARCRGISPEPRRSTAATLTSYWCVSASAPSHIRHSPFPAAIWSGRRSPRGGKPASTSRSRNRHHSRFISGVKTVFTSFARGFAPSTAAGAVGVSIEGLIELVTIWSCAQPQTSAVATINADTFGNNMALPVASDAHRDISS